MNEVKIVLNSNGIQSMLKSDKVKKVVKRYADRAKKSLGEGYEVSTHVGVYRVNAEVAAVSYEAKKDNLDNNSILKAVSSLD